MVTTTGPGGDVGTAAGPVVVPTRHWVRVISGVIGVAVLVYIGWRLTHLNKIDYNEITAHLTQHSVLVGLKNTVLLTIYSQAIGIVLGVVLAVMRLSKNPVFSAAAWLYIWFFRGTPLIVQILFWFNGLLLVITRVHISVFGWTVIDKPAANVITIFVASVLALALNEGAYMAEIVRAGILSVDRGQTEAAEALGMRGGMVMRRVVLPQAMRVILPPTGNELISMLKNTSLVVVIGEIELLGRATAIYSVNGRVFELLIMTCIWYLIATSVAQVGQHYLERRYARGNAVDLPPTLWQRAQSLRARMTA